MPRPVTDLEIERQSLVSDVAVWLEAPLRASTSDLFTVAANGHPYIRDILACHVGKVLPVEETSSWEGLFGLLTPTGAAALLPGFLQFVLHNYKSTDTVLLDLLGRLAPDPLDSADEQRAAMLYIDAVRAKLTTGQRETMARFATWLTGALQAEGIGYEWLADSFLKTWAQHDGSGATNPPSK